ncbi:29238_t:CDS:2, partial [Gigaspora margarita]
DNNKNAGEILNSVDKGNANAKNMVGYCYYAGNGTSIDRKETFEYYIKSAKGGCITSQINLWSLGKGTYHGLQ